MQVNTPRETKTSEICGFQMVCLSFDEVLEHFLERLKANQGGWVVTLNLEILSLCRLDPAYRAMIGSADYVLADGMPFVWASRLKKGVQQIPERTTGSDLSGELIRRYDRKKIAIIGGESPPQALKALAIEDHEDVFIFDGIVDMSDEGIQTLLAAVKAHGANLVFVALGVPKQDKVAKAFRAEMPEALILGVGGTFELIGGMKIRAPIWMQQSGTEWLWRLYVEPRRLWRRYLLLYWLGLGQLVDDTFLGFRRLPTRGNSSQ